MQLLYALFLALLGLHSAAGQATCHGDDGTTQTASFTCTNHPNFENFLGCFFGATADSILEDWETIPNSSSSGFVSAVVGDTGNIFDPPYSVDYFNTLHPAGHTVTKTYDSSIRDLVVYAVGYSAPDTNPISVRLDIVDCQPQMSISCETADNSVNIVADCLQVNDMVGTARGCFITRTPVDYVPSDMSDLATDIAQLAGLAAAGELATYPEELEFGPTGLISDGGSVEYTFDGAGEFRFAIYMVDEVDQTTVFGRIVDQGVICGVPLASFTILGGDADKVIADNDFTPSVEDGTLVTLSSDTAGSATFRITADVDDMTIDNISIIPASDDFSLVLDAALPLTIATNNDATFNIAFAGAPVGDYPITVRVSSASGTTQSFRVLVRVEELPIANVVADSDISINLFDVSTAELSAVISNLGDARLDLDAAMLSGDVDVFSLVTLTEQSSVNVGGSTTLRVKYEPTNVGEHQVRVMIPSNLPSGDIVVNFAASAVSLKFATVAIDNVADQLKYDAGPVVMPASATLTVPVQLSAVGGDIAITSATTTGDVALLDSIEGLVKMDDTFAFQVQLSLLANVVTTGTLVLETDDAVEATKTLTFSASGIASGILTATSGGSSLDADSPLVLPTVIASLTSASATVTLTNTGVIQATVSSVDLSAAPAGLSMSSTLNGRVFGPGESSTIAFTYAPNQDVGELTATVAVTLVSGSVLSFDIETSTGVVLWAPGVQPEYTVSEGQELDLAVTLPTTISDDQVDGLVFFVASETNVDDNDVDLVVSANGLEATVRVAVNDDELTEDAQVAVLQLVSGGATVTINVPASNQVVAEASLSDVDINENVSITVSGAKPLSAQDDGIERGSVRVSISPSDTIRSDGSVGGGRVVVRIIEDDDIEGDLAVTNFSIEDESRSDGTRLETAGTSFTIELEGDVVLASEIEVESRFECGTDEEDLILLLFDLEASPPAWVPADSKCDVPTPPIVDETACVATFTICHLTQFVIARRFLPTSPANSASESSTGANVDEDGLDDGWIAVIIVAALLAAALCCCLVVILNKRRKKQQDTQEFADSALEKGEVHPTDSSSEEMSSSASLSDASSESS